MVTSGISGVGRRGFRIERVDMDLLRLRVLDVEENMLQNVCRVYNYRSIETRRNLEKTGFWGSEEGRFKMRLFDGKKHCYSSNMEGTK